MIGKTNVGGGGSAAWAVIGVTYPEGSTCTATDGTNTLTAAGTSGLFIFNIPEPDTTPVTWTVSCTDGTRTKSLQATLTTQYQFVEIILSYSILPIEYQEVEYLESTVGGGQYINLGSSDHGTVDEYDMTFMRFSDNSSEYVVAGSWLTQLYGYNVPSSSTHQYRVNNQAFVSQASDGEIITVTINDSSNQMVENEITLGTVTSTGNNVSMCLFGASYSSAATELGHARIYSFAHKNNSTGTYLMRLYPCYRRTDNVAGMYDIVNGTFYTNSGTGTFVVGADV